MTRDAGTDASIAVVIDSKAFDAIVFDMDGVITDTARVHYAAWKRLFDDWLEHWAPDGVATDPFTEDDYHHHVDGRSRLDGIAGFLASRGASLPAGSSDDPAGGATVWALANRKNAFFRAALAEEGATAFPSTLALTRAALDVGMRTAVISASRNRAAVLASAGADELYEVHVDGVDAAELGLPGKPDPAIFTEAARRLGVEAERAVAIEDALPGVEAAARADYGLVIGVDRSGGREADFVSHGADAVVSDLAAVSIGSGE